MSYHRSTERPSRQSSRGTTSRPLRNQSPRNYNYSRTSRSNSIATHPNHRDRSQNQRHRNSSRNERNQNPPTHNQASHQRIVTTSDRNGGQNKNGSQKSSHDIKSTKVTINNQSNTILTDILIGKFDHVLVTDADIRFAKENMGKFPHSMMWLRGTMDDYKTENLKENKKARWLIFRFDELELTGEEAVPTDLTKSNQKILKKLTTAVDKAKTAYKPYQVAIVIPDTGTSVFHAHLAFFALANAYPLFFEARPNQKKIDDIDADDRLQGGPH